MDRTAFESVILSFFLYLMVFSGLEAIQDDCKESSCEDDGPVVRFPFWLNGHQPHHCGYPGFELSCTVKNETVLELPFSGKFFVRSIDYSSQLVEIRDPYSCMFRRLLHLNFSTSPFEVGSRFSFLFSDYLTVIHFTSSHVLFNCSSTVSTDQATLISCLSISGYPIYAYRADSLVGNLPIELCNKVKTIEIPYYSENEYGSSISSQRKEYLSDPNLGLLFSWTKPICRNCEAMGKKCRLKSNTTRSSETECVNIYKPPSHPAIGVSTKLVIIGVTCGFALLVVVILASIRFYCVYNSNKIEKENQIRIEKFLEDYKSLKPTRYSYADIKRFTNQFKEKMGEGGYGSVFKGKLSSDIPVAVKILNNSQGNGEEFINEVGTIGRTHHVNVVRLVGFCADGFRRALVYEFLPNESLEKFIFSRQGKNPFLGWEKLQDIAIGIAKGIEYLHQGCSQRILHFDIKPHNILLDANFNPKISDFGLAKLCSKDVSFVPMTSARGTKGYIAPEVLSRNFGNVSTKSDVYSFGILLLEIVGGKMNIKTTKNTSQQFLPEWIYNHLNQGEDLEIKVDEDRDGCIAKKLTTVALWCIQWYPVDRPSMTVVVQMLEGDTEGLIMPPNPFASTTTLKTSVANLK